MLSLLCTFVFVLISYYICVSVAIFEVGYGDITPNNIAEYAVCAVCMLLGGFMWAFIIGEVCSATANMDVKRLEYHHKFDQVRPGSLAGGGEDEGSPDAGWRGG